MSGHGGLDITAQIDGRQVSRAEVLAWEERRSIKVCKKLGVTAPPGDLIAQREALVARKLELGHEALERLLARELRWSLRLSARILLDESDTGTVVTTADPDFPVQWVAVGRGKSGGRPAGAIRHQFRDEPKGFRVRLTGEFPTTVPPFLVRAHQWHLACEFSNWIEAANAA